MTQRPGRGRVTPKKKQTIERQPPPKLVFGQHEPCSWCRGTGKRPHRKELCGACNGTGYYDKLNPGDTDG